MSNERLVDIDPQNAPGNIDELETSLKEAVAESREPEKAEAMSQEEAKVDERPEHIPEKFWTGDYNESVSKMAESYTNLQSAYGRMANDLGTQRKLTDKLLALDKRDEDLGTTKPKVTPIDPTKLVDNPTETLESWYEERRKADLEQEQATADQTRAEREEQEFITKYPDWQETTASPEFAEWVTSSPLRSRAAQLAGAGDYSAADALLTEYEVAKGTPPEGKKEPDHKAEARAASLESANQSPGKSGGRIYRRADLIELRMNKPETYGDPSFQEEIMRAYAEGRVK